MVASRDNHLPSWGWTESTSDGYHRLSSGPSTEAGWRFCAPSMTMTNRLPSGAATTAAGWRFWKPAVLLALLGSWAALVVVTWPDHLVQLGAGPHGPNSLRNIVLLGMSSKKQDAVEEVQKDLAKAEQNGGKDEQNLMKKLQKLLPNQDKDTLQKEKVAGGISISFLFMVGCSLWVLREYILPKAIGYLVKSGAEHWDRQVLGVDVEVGNVEVYLFRGKVKIDKFKIHNPDGFQADYLLEVDHIIVDLHMTKFLCSLTKRVEVEEVTLDTMCMTYEPGSNNGPSNVQVIQDRLAGDKKDPPPPPPPPSSRTVKLRLVQILGTVVKLHGPLAKRCKDFDGPELTLDDIVFDDFAKEQKEKGAPLTTTEIVSFILATLLKSVTHAVTSMSIGGAFQMFGAMGGMVASAASQGLHVIEDKAHAVVDAVDHKAHEAVAEVKHAAEVVEEKVEQQLHHVGEMLGLVSTTPTKEAEDDWVDPHEKCPQGHELLLFEAHGVTCDRCRQPILDGTRTYKCPPCDYDLCPRCYRTLGTEHALKKVQSPDKDGKSPSTPLTPLQQLRVAMGQRGLKPMNVCPSKGITEQQLEQLMMKVAGLQLSPPELRQAFDSLRHNTCWTIAREDFLAWFNSGQVKS